MNPDTSTPKLTLRHKLSNGFVLFTAIWSSAIMPVMPSYAKMLTPDDLPTLGSDSVLSNSNDKTEKFIAEYSQSAARFISDKKKAADLADMAQDFARSKVTNAATDEINNWLSKAGNAKFSVDVDKKLSIKNTQLDWLVPWHDSADLLLFTQHNLHRTDGRLQANNGIGVRHFTPERMMGVNAFFDHDLSRYHSRLGLGAEYAQDFLKLSANTYMRTSSWRSASELDNDYNARPANGWDLQAEGWLPSYPNIGGNLKFEQYFGDDVALFGKDKRQKDPLATTVGVNWTPFSLVTLSAEQKISGGLSETNAKVQFTWALGKSLAEQLDPSKVGDARRLMGSRYDFVNRNNNIVLEYQKKTLITLSLPSMIQGKTGELLPLINTLNTKYPLDKLTVQAPEFLTAGGEIILDGAATRVKLPSYQVAMTEQERKKINLYRFTITASDSKGNISPQATTLVEVTNSGVLSIKQSEVIKQGNAVANGKDINTLTITARDSLGHVAPDSIVTFTLPPELKLTTQKATSSSMAFSNLFKKMQAAKSTTQQKYDIVTNMKGEASIQFTSLVTGEHHIQAAAGKGAPIEAAFIFIADTQQAHINAFNIISDNAVADGKASNKIKFYITDDNNHPIKGAILQLEAKNATVKQLSPTDEQGNTEVEVKSQAAGPVKITATLNEQAVTVETHFVFGQLAHVTIADLAQAAAGTDSSITISLTDINNNPVSGADGSVTVNINGKPTPIIITETRPGSGVYTGKLPGQHTGTPSITVTVDGQTSSPETLIVEQPKPISPNNSNGTGQKGEKGVIDNITITPNKTQSLQSGDTLEVTVTITDTFGNGLPGLNTDNIDIGKHKGDTLTWTDNGDGTYTTTLPLTEVGTNDLTASVNGSTSPKTDIQVNHATGTTHVDKVKITKIEKPAAGMDSTVTIELTDKHGNSVVGEKEITININGQPHTLPTTETSPGIYQVIIDGQLAGNHDLSAVVNGEESPKELLIVDKPQPVKPKDPSGAGQKGEQGVVDTIEIKTGNTVGLQSGDQLEITVTITDAFNNGLAGLNTNNIDIGKHKGDTLAWVDNGDGSYTTTLPLTEVGNNDLTASINGSTSSQKQIQVSNATGKDKVSKVEIIKTGKPAAGSNSTLTVQLTDKNSNPVVGETEIIVNIDGKPHTLPAKEGKPGIYDITLPALQTGNHSIEANVNGTSSIKESLVVESPKPISPNNSNGTGQQGEKGVVDKVAITLDHSNRFESGNPLDITVTVTDAFGNGLVDLNTDNIDIGKHKGSTLNWVDNGDGTYTTTLILTDVGSNDLTVSVNGTHSPHTEVQVNNATGAPHVDKVNITKIEKPAAGTESIITIELTDKHGNLVVGENEITVNIDGQAHKLPAKEGKPGIYEVTLPALQAGNHNISASVNGKGSTDTTLVVTPPTPIKSNSTGKPGEKGVINNVAMTTGNTSNLQSGDPLEITVTITDAFNNGLIGLNTITLSGVNGKPVWTDKGDGSYTTIITLTEIGSKDLTASINGHKTPVKPIQINPAKGTDKVSKVEIIKTEKPAAGSSSILTVELTDKNSNPVVGEQEIIVEIDGKLHTLPAKEGKPGIYEVTLPALQAGNHSIEASVNNTPSIKESLVVELPKPISPNNSNGTGQQGEKGVIDKVIITSNKSHGLQSGDPLELTVTITDAFNNGLAGLNTNNIDIGKHKGNTLSWVDNGDGTYTTTLPLTEVGNNDVTASINGTHSPHTEVQVNNASGTAHVDKVKIIKTEQPAAGTDSLMTIELTDKHGNPVVGETEITVNIEGNTHKLVATEKPNGIYEVTLPALQAGNHNINVSVNGKNSTDATLVVKKPTSIQANSTGKPGEKGVVNSIVMTTGNTDNLQSGSQLEISVAITDAFGNGLTALNTNNIKLEGYNGKPVWKDNRDGSYSATITLTEVGAKGLGASIDGNKTLVKPIQINLAKGTDKVSKVAIIKTEQPAAGSSSILTVELTDKNSNPVVGETEIIVNIDNKPHTLPAKEGKSGIYDVTLPALQTGNYQITAVVNGQDSVKNTLEVKKPAPVSSNNTSGTGNSGERGVINNITMTTGDITHLQSGDSLNITVTIVDAFNNPLTTIDTSNMILDGYKASSLKWLDKGNGTYTTPLLLTQTGSTDLTASINGHKSQLISITVSNAMDINKVANVELEPITPSEAGENQTITVKVTDKYQHPVTTIANNITVKINQQAQILQFTESASNKGSYTATLPVEKMGDYNVEVSANSQNTSKIWQVKKPAIITVKNNNGSGTENQRGVVKTVELTSSPTKDLKSGDSLQLTVTLKDNFGNYLDGVDGSHIQLQNQQAKTVSWSDNRNGSYTAILPLTNIGEDDLVATVNSHASPLISIKVGNATGTTQIKQVEIKSLTKPAAGETSSITLALTDANNQSITGIDSNVVVSIDGAEELLKIAETNSKGTYTGTLSGQKAGDHKVIVTVGGVKSAESTLTVTSPTAIANNNSGKKGSRGVVNTATLTVSPSKDLKSGDTLKLTVTLKDAFDNSLTGVDLGQSLTHHQKGKVTWAAQKDGTYTASLVLTQLGQDHLFITANKIQSSTAVIDVKPQLGINAIHKVDIIDVTPAAAGAGSEFTVALTDKNGHPVTGIKSVDVKLGQQQLSNVAVTQQADGRYTGKLPGQLSGSHPVIVTTNNQASTPKPLHVAKPDTTLAAPNGGGTAGARGVVNEVTLAVTPNTNVKSGDNLQLTVTLKDKFSNPLKGVTSITLQQNQGSTVTWSDNNNGSYNASLPLKLLGPDALTITVNNVDSSTTNITVMNSTDINQVKQLTMETITATAAGTQQHITVKALDINNLGVTQIADDINITLNDKLLNLTFVESKTYKGTYTTRLPEQKAGNYSVKVTANKQQAQQSWGVNSAKTLKATNRDGSGVQGQVGVVHTVELTTSLASNYKSNDIIKLVLTLKDAFDNPLQGIDIKNIMLTHNQTGGHVTWVDEQNGTYVANLNLRKLGEDVLTVTVNKKQSNTIPINVIKQSDSTAIRKAEILTISPIAAGAESTFTVALTDAQGNSVEGVQYVDITIGRQKQQKIAVTQQTDGRYTGKLLGQQTGDYDVVITANSKPSTPKILQVAKPDTVTAVSNGGGTAGARGVVNEVTLAVTPNTNVKSGDNLQLTVTLKDKFSNPLKGVTSITLQQNQGSTVTWSDNNNGSYTTTLPVKVLGSGTLKAIVNQKESSTVNITVENTNQVNQVDKVIIDPIAPSEAGKAGNLTVKIQDTHQQGVTQIANDIKVTINDKLADLKFTEISTKGTYSATLPASKAGSYTVKVTANKKENQQSWVVKAASIIKATQTDGSGKAETQGVVKTVELKASTVQNLKSGDKLTLTLTLKDAFDNTLTGIALDKITLTHNQTGKVIWTEQNNGTYTASLLLDTLGTDTLISTVNSVNNLPISIIVKKAEGSNSVKQVEIINIAPAAAGAGSDFTVALTDKNGHPVTGIKSVDVKMGQQQLSNVAVTQQADGRYIGTLPGQLSGSHPVIITANGLLSTEKPFNVATPDTVLATQNGGGAKGTRGVVNDASLAVTPNTNVKSGDNLQLTVTLKDKFSNPLKGVTSITLQQNQGSTVTWSDNNNGSYTALLPLKVLGKDPLKAIVNSVNSTSVNITVANADQVTQVKTINLDSIDASAAGQAKIITVKAKDSHGNGVTQIDDDIKVTINDKLADIKFTETSTKGTYSATLPASKAGSYTVKVTANKYTEQQSWAVSPATTIKAAQTDGSGKAETQGVVKTVELKASTVQNLKSGDKLTLTLTLKDAFDNTLTGIALDKITLTHNQIGKVTWIESKNGTYTASLLLDALGNDELTATVNYINSQTLPIRVEKAVGGSHVDKITILAMLPMMAGAESTLAISLTDANGHPIEGIKEVTAKIGNKNPSVILVSQQPNGNYVGTLPGQQQGKYDLVISVNNHDSAAKTLTVAKPTTLVVINGNGSGAKNQRGVVDDLLFTTAPTDNLKTSDKLKLTVTLKDYFDNPLRGIESKSIVINHKQTSSVVWKDNADGTYTAELLLKKQGKDTLKVTVNNNSKEVNINVGSPEGKSAVQNVKLDIINSKLSVNDSVELKLTLTDSHGNGVEKVQTSDIQLEHDNTLVSKLIWLEQSAGVYTTTLPLHKQGKNTFVSRVNNQTNTPLTINVSALTGSVNVKAVEFKASTNQLTVGSTTELTLQLTDQWGNGVEGIKIPDITINDAHTKKDLTGLIWTSKGNGIYTTPAVISIAGIHSLRATVNKIPSTNVLIEVKPSTDSKRVHKVALTATPNVITAGDNLTLSLKVTDADNNPVINLNNSDIGYTGISSKGPIIWKEDSHGLGIYTTTTMLSEVKTHTLSAGIGKFTDTTNVAVNSPMGKDVVKTITISPIADSDAGQPSSLSISLTDQYGNTVKNVSSSDIKLKINDKEQSIVFMEKNVMNKYIAQLPASKASRYKITVEVNGQSESTNWNVKVPKEILISSYNKDGLRGSLDTLSITHSATKNTVNSAEKVTLTVGLKDKFGNKLTGASSNLTLLTGLQSTSIWKELKDGFYSQELTMNKLHKQPIQVAADNILSDKIELTVAPAKGTNNVHKTTLSTDEGTIEAGKEVTLTLALTDSVDNGVIDINTKDIQLTNNGKPTNVKWTNPQDGVYTTKQRLETVGNYQFKATVNKKPSRIQTVEATYPSGKDVVNSATLSTKTTGLNAGEKTELTLTLNDQYGNLVTGVNGADIELTDNHSAETINSSSIAWKMESVGVYKATLPLTKVGKHTLTAVVNKQNANTKEITVKALKGTSNVKDIKLTTVATSMSAGESTTLTLTMFDNYGNEVADVTTKDIKFKNTDSTITTKASWVKTPSHDSVYTAQITLEKVKAHTLSVEVNGQVKNIEIEVKPLEGDKNVAKVNLTASATAKLGVDTLLTLQLKDQFGNGVVNVDQAKITQKLTNTLIQINWVEGKDGNYTSNLSLTKVGVYSLEAKVNGYPSTTSITIENPNDVKNVENISMKSSITADGSGKYITKPGQEFQLTFTLTDQYDNGVTDLQVTDISLIDTQTSTAIPIKAWQEDSTQKGKYTTTVTLTKIAQYDLTAKVNKASDTIQISLTPFADPKNIKTIHLSLVEQKANIGKEVVLGLKLIDIYGNNVFVDTREIKLLDVGHSSLQVRWNTNNSTATHRYMTGSFNLTELGKHTISASIGQANSNPEVITVEAGAPVFASGKSRLYSNTDNTNTKHKTTTIWLILKDDNGNAITGKKPILSSNYWNQRKEMKEVGTDGKYTIDFDNNGNKGVAEIALDNSSINYTGNNQTIQIINYGEMSITRLGVEKTYAIDEQFPHTGFTGTQFRINPSLGTASDYNWKVNQNWLSIDSKGIVTLNKQPEDGSKVKVTITGKAKDNNIKDMVYTFNISKWFSEGPKINKMDADKYCVHPKRMVTPSDIRSGGTSLIITWPLEIINANMKQNKITESDSIWAMYNGTNLYYMQYNFASEIPSTTGNHVIICVKDY